MVNNEAAGMNNIQVAMEAMDIDTVDNATTITTSPHPDTLVSMTRSLSLEEILPSHFQGLQGTSLDPVSDGLNNGASTSATINQGQGATSAHATSAGGLEEGTYITAQNITVKLAFKVRRAGHILPPGKVQLRIFTGNGHSRLIVVDEEDVAGMGLKRVQENPKKRLIKQQRMREMGMEVEKKVTPRKVLLDERRRKIEGVENDMQKMVRDWKEKRKIMGFNEDWSVNDTYAGETYVGEDGRKYATMGMKMA
ncbi:hypothetical protein FPQ18DRAFT_307833 [Pyronema domesticum]|uniref:Uncharacterized protein n=1 Tax=Pyronema omphalodes (strain CBS 100304) TaxID=1076935 RepID=U4LH29_PYROM|nr:hypothetical protein FPQ18DRAFT_307833 [Pyronema domesticum]CCX15724.1 Protein of unknown function [Pyronema omphalodes CBS 100304]